MPTPAPKRVHKDKSSEKARLRTLQGEKRPTSAPARMDGDLTGMTMLLETPAKGGEYGSLNKNEPIESGASGM